MSSDVVPPGMTAAWRRWGPQAPAGVVVFLIGLAAAAAGTSSDYYTLFGDPVLVVFAVLFGVAVALSRFRPIASLALVWFAGVIQIVLAEPVGRVELSITLVAYGCARWGRGSTVLLSGLSIPVAAVVGVYVVDHASSGIFRELINSPSLIDGAYRLSGTLLVGATILGVLVLVVPWLAGLAVRALARARRSEVGQIRAEEQVAQAQVETGQAHEIARLREEQAQLARDVHDVVGHSLAVILAQAESAQYLPDDPAQLKATMATIAGSARSSLQDVRQVLAGPGRAPAPARTGAFEQLLDGVRAGGHEVLAAEVGTPQPLPPELDVVAHRVAQEMLTNAIRHGRRDSPVHVERHWPGNGFERDLRIEVRNVVDTAADPGPGSDETQPLTAVPTADDPPGQGLLGMRRRLDAVGGRLDVRRRAEPEGPTFTVTAWVPVSGR